MTPETESGQMTPIATVPFEVVRRTEYVFEPFMGSLIQLPEATMYVRQSTEFFLAQQPEQVTIEASGGAEIGEELVWEKPSATLQAATQTENPQTAAAQNATPLVNSQQAKNKRAANEQERPRFYQPQTVRFFDPVAAAAEAEGEEGADFTAQMGPRASNELSAELKAAIWQIDEQFRQKQKEQKPKEHEKTAKETKRGFLRSRLAKRTEVQETRDDVRALEAAPATRGARWEEIAASEATAWVEARPTAASSAPLVEMREAVVPPAREPELPRLAAPLVESLPIAGQSAAMLAEASLTVEPQTGPAVETPTTAAHLTAPAVESLPTTDQKGMQVVPSAAIVEKVTGPVAERLAIETQQTAPVIGDAAAPVVVKAVPRTTRSAKAKQIAVQPLPPQVDERLKVTAAAISQVRPADLRSQQGTVYAQTPVYAQIPIAEEAPKIAKEKPRKTKEEEKLSLAMRFQNWLLGEDVSKTDAANHGSRRRAERTIMPGLVAFYWSGGTPKPHEIVNISRTGFYLKTKDLWSLETLVRMTLQKPGSDRKRESVSVLARVVRIDEEGVGHEFVTTEALMNARSLDVMPSHGTNWRELDRLLSVG